MSLFTNKTLLITGGTGSFGNAVLNRFLKTDIKEIIFDIRNNLIGTGDVIFKCLAAEFIFLSTEQLWAHTGIFVIPLQIV